MDFNNSRIILTKALGTEVFWENMDCEGITFTSNNRISLSHKTLGGR